MKNPLCKNCESLQEKVLYLMKTIDVISKGKSNFENVLASQTCVFGKSGLGFNPQSEQTGCTRTFPTFTQKQSVKKLKQPVVCCFYCMKKGHSVRFCRIRKFFVPKGILKWVPKEPNVSWKYINTYGLWYLFDWNRLSCMSLFAYECRLYKF